MASIDIDGTNGDVIGTGLSGKVNIAGKEVTYTYTVKDNIININNPSSEIIKDLEKILKEVPLEVSSSKKKDVRVTEKIEESKAAEPVVNDVVDLMNKVKVDAGRKPDGIKAGALNVSSDDVMIRKSMLEGNKYFFKGEYNTALTHYEEVTGIDPYYAEAWENKGNVLEELKNYDQAIRCYDKAIQINPSYGNAWYSKGDLLNRRRSQQKFLISLATSLTFLLLFVIFIPWAASMGEIDFGFAFGLFVWDSLGHYLPLILISAPTIVLFFFFWYREGAAYYKEMTVNRRRIIILTCTAILVFGWALSFRNWDNFLNRTGFDMSEFFPSLQFIIISAVVTVNLVLFLWNTRGEGDRFLNRANDLSKNAGTTPTTGYFQ